MHDHEIYDDTPSSYLDDIADIGEKHIRLSYPNFILLLARLDTDYNYAQYLVRCLYAKHLADELRHPNISGYLEEQDELSNALHHFRVTIPGIIARRSPSCSKPAPCRCPHTWATPGSTTPTPQNQTSLLSTWRHPTAILKYGFKSLTNTCGSTKNTAQTNSATFYSGRGTTPPELKLSF